MSKLSDIIGRGLLAARPAAGIEGRLYYATDGDGALYRDNGTTWDSVEGTGAGAAGALADLTDVDVTTTPPADGDRLVWVDADGTWQPVAGSGGGAEALDDLTDVDLTTTPPATDDVLTYDGTGWVPAAPTGGGGSLTVEEDGGTSVASVTTITVPTGSLTDDGSGAVTLNLSPLMVEQLRLDAGAGITKDGSDLVSLWSDQSLYERYAVQPTATNQPLWVDNVINSEPVLRFDGADNYMMAALNANIISTFTIAAVFRPRDSATAEGMMSWANAPTSGLPFVIWQRDSTNVKVFVDSGYRFTVAHATDATKLYVLTFNGIQWDLYVDGVAQTPFVGADSSRTNGQFLYLGVGFNGYSYVDIPAVEVYGRVLSSGDRGTLTTRLMTKYGL